MRTVLVGLLGSLSVVACTGGDAALPDEGPPPGLTGPLLAFDATESGAANSDTFPAGFSSPQGTVCGPDVTRGFLTELIDHGLTDPNVPFEWAPIVPGPIANRPTLGQPELYLSGSVAHLEKSGLDFRPPHPFGFDTTFDIQADDPFLDLVDNRDGSANDGDIIHCEMERGLFPDSAFGYAPAIGDRALLRGAWILDCGHPPYEAEIHPPTFVAFAREEAGATVALAFATPYRTTQLYGRAALANRFDDERFDDPTVSPFTTQFEVAIIKAGIGQIEQFELHPLIEATEMEPVSWYVCAPQPRPAGATLHATYRFAARTGVTISVATRGDSGCLRFHAEMGRAYAAAVPSRLDYLWPWRQISDEASQQYGQPIDVREAALDAAVGAGFPADIKALQEDTPLLIDAYTPLAPRANASADAPTAIVTGADDQPFPFYGRVRLSWN